MWPLLFAGLSTAAELPPGSHVVVARGAALTIGDRTAVPVIDGPGWPAEVVADDGDVLRVRFATDGCVEPLSTSGLDVVVRVREADLLPLVEKDVSGRDPRGDAWLIGTGTPILARTGDALRVPFDAGLVIDVPAGTVQGTLAVVAPGRLAEPDPTGSARVKGGVAGTFRGAPLGGLVGELPVSPVRAGRLRWRGRCETIDFHGTATAPAADLMGDLLKARWKRLQPGTALSWPDGSDAGAVRSPTVLPEPYTTVDDRVCAPFALSTTWDTGAPAITLCARAADLPPAPVPAPPPTTPVILGALDKSAIDDVIKRHMHAIARCYQGELTKNPALGGRITVKFVIAKDGAVSSAATRYSTVDDATVERCVNAQFLRMRFPEPVGGGIVIVSYPFVFSPR